MSTKLQTTTILHPGQPKNLTSYLDQEYERWQSLFKAQPALIQRYFEAQAHSLADALLQPASQARFSLPDRVIASPGDPKETPVLIEQREQMVGGYMDRLTRAGLVVALRQRLDELEASVRPPVAASAGLLRYSTATGLVSNILPSGRSVRYEEVEGEEIPTLPIDDDQGSGSAIMASTDAITEEGFNHSEEGQGELSVPYVPAARRFFLPQWVAFGEQDQLLVHSVTEAEAQLGSMQRYMHILHMAISLASYIVADVAYQQKRYGMLGQLINQGRALARYETREMIVTIQRRAAANDLNRGLSLSLPYFDDQSLEMKTHDFDVIPSSRVMFIPAFIVLAVRKELAKVGQDTRLNRSTRKHLLNELDMLSAAFERLGQQYK